MNNIDNKTTYIISDIDKAVYFEETALELRNQGVDVTFLLINCAPDGLTLFLKQNNFRVFELSCGKLIHSLRPIWKCKKILDEIKPDVVHCHLAHANWVGLWGAKLCGIKKRIYTRHSGEPLNIGRKEQIIDKIQNRLATGIIAISKTIESLLIRQGVPENKISLIHHGFQLSKFDELPAQEIDRIKKAYNPNGNSPVIGVVARWMEWKGVQYTIEAFTQLLETHPNALLALFGGSEKGDYGKEIAAMISSIPEKNVICVSYERNVFAIYSMMDVYVHVPVNNSCEAFGQTYIEALAAKCPSVFTLSGIASEFIEHKQNALVVPFEDSKEIGLAILNFLENPILKNEIILNGSQSVLEFNFNKYINKLIQLYV